MTKDKDYSCRELAVVFIHSRQKFYKQGPALKFVSNYTSSWRPKDLLAREKIVYLKSVYQYFSMFLLGPGRWQKRWEKLSQQDTYQQIWAGNELAS